MKTLIPILSFFLFFLLSACSKHEEDQLEKNKIYEKAKADAKAEIYAEKERLQDSVRRYKESPEYKEKTFPHKYLKIQNFDHTAKFWTSDYVICRIVNTATICDIENPTFKISIFNGKNLLTSWTHTDNNLYLNKGESIDYKILLDKAPNQYTNFNIDVIDAQAVIKY